MFAVSYIKEVFQHKKSYFKDDLFTLNVTPSKVANFCVVHVTFANHGLPAVS